jgi:hypothetical protein
VLLEAEWLSKIESPPHPGKSMTAMLTIEPRTTREEIFMACIRNRVAVRSGASPRSERKKG